MNRYEGYDRYRDVMVKVVASSDEHCSTECSYLEHGGKNGICTLFGSLSYDEKEGEFKRILECMLAER